MRRPTYAGSSDHQGLAYYFEVGVEAGDLSSNFMAMIAALNRRMGERAPLEGWTTQIRPKDSHPAGLVPELREEVLDRCSAARPVRRVLAVIGEPHATVLRAAYGPRPPGMAAFGEAASIAPLTSEAHERWRRSGTGRTLGEWLVRLSWRTRHGPQPGDAFAVRAITFEAEGLLARALGVFGKAFARYEAMRQLRRSRAARARRELVAAGAVVEDVRASP